MDGEWGTGGRKLLLAHWGHLLVRAERRLVERRRAKEIRFG